MTDVKKSEVAANNQSSDEVLKQLEIESKRLELELKKKQLEALELESKEREFNIKDLKARISEREIREKQLMEDRSQQGRTFAQQDATDQYRWSVCTHRKGGVVTPRDMRVLSTGGNKEQYAVFKHQMINGDIWVRCLRCGKTWQPPVESNFYYRDGKVVAPQDGTFDQAKFDKACEEYRLATMFNTNNSTSSSVQCRFTYFDPETKKHVDAADIYRQNIASSNLR